MTNSTPDGTLGEDEQKRQETLDQIEMSHRLVSVAAIRAEIGDNPNLTEADCQALAAASDRDILDTIDSAATVIEDRLYALHDELQAEVVTALTSA